MNPEDKLAAIYATDFPSFAHRSYADLFGSRPYHSGWHVEVISSHLERVRTGEVRRLGVHMPPRHGKSFLTTVVFPAWILGHDPTAHIFSLSYGQDLSKEHAHLTRKLMGGEFYRSVFRTRIDHSRDTNTDFFTTDGGRLLSESLHGVLTGRGADYILIDDPIKANDVYSEARRKTANESFFKTVHSRLNNHDTGSAVLSMQRLHSDDFANYAESRGAWEVVSIPLIAEEDEKYSVSSIFGDYTISRKAGSVIHPKMMSLQSAEDLRREYPEYVFSAMYQQNPQPEGGNILKREYLNFYEPHERPEKFQRIIQSWDTANKDTQLSDYSACTTWGVSNKKMYLLNVFRHRLDFPSLKRAVLEQASLFEANVVLVEDKASGTSLIQDLRNDGFSRVQAAPSLDGDKIMRLHSQTARFEGGFVLLPKFAVWLEEYLHEMLSFPNAKYDDQVDSTVYALAYNATASHYGWTDEGLRNFAQIFDNTDVHPLANYFSRLGLF